jgi:hypothetical protein
MADQYATHEQGDVPAGSFSVWWLSGGLVAAFTMNRPDEEWVDAAKAGRREMAFGNAGAYAFVRLWVSGKSHRRRTDQNVHLDGSRSRRASSRPGPNAKLPGQRHQQDQGQQDRAGQPVHLPGILVRSLE